MSNIKIKGKIDMPKYLKYFLPENISKSLFLCNLKQQGELRIGRKYCQGIWRTHSF